MIDELEKGMNKHQKTLIHRGRWDIKKGDYHIGTSRHVNMNMVGCVQC
jgi:hypothetical protein